MRLVQKVRLLQLSDAERAENQLLDKQYPERFRTSRAEFSRTNEKLRPFTDQLAQDSFPLHQTAEPGGQAA